MVTLGCSANLSATITTPLAPEEAQETIDSDKNAAVNAVWQSIPDENHGDKIVHDVLAEVKLPSTIHKSLTIHSLPSK